MGKALLFSFFNFKLLALSFLFSFIDEFLIKAANTVSRSPDGGTATAPSLNARRRDS